MGFKEKEKDMKIEPTLAQTYKNPPPIGATITVEYFEITKAGKPRFPVYKGMRAEQ